MTKERKILLNYLLKQYKQSLKQFNSGDNVKIVYPQSSLNSTNLSKYFNNQTGLIIGTEMDGKTKMFRVRLDKPVKVPGLSDPVTSDLWSKEYLKKAY